jgi:hypothetical protein
VRCAVAAATVVLFTACGGSSKKEPSPEDADLVAAAVGDIVYQCGQYTAGQVSAPDASALEADVDALLDASERLEPDASFELGAQIGLPQTTSLREQVELGARVLDEGCVPEQAERLAGALD